MKEEILVNYQNVEIYQLDNKVLKNINLKVSNGEFIYLFGKVGSGKSSFLKSIYAETDIKKGRANVLGHKLHLSLKRKEIALLRRKIGIIFQDFQLLTDRTVYKNLEFILKATGWKNKQQIEKQISHVLKQVGLQTKGFKMPHQLSGGEQQRIVIARALLNSPEIILADEPTGNLDPKTGKDIMQLLHSITEQGTTVLVATHNLSWVDMFQGRVLRCEDKQISEVTNAEHS